MNPMASDEEGLASPQEPEVPGMFDNGLAELPVRIEGIQTEVLDTRVSSMPPVSVVGRAVEIRGDAAGVMVEILEEWIKAQNRRVEFLRRGGVDLEARRQIQAIQSRMGHVYRLLEAWDRVKLEGGMTVPNRDTDIE